MLEFHYHTKVEYQPNTDLNFKLDAFKKIINDPNYGFFHLTDDYSHIESAQKLFEKFQEKKNFIQIGIGGSALGPQMLIQALAKNDRQFYFIDNIDSEEISDILFKINPEESLFYVVSKSGGTAETVAGHSIVQSWLLKNGVEEKDFKNYFVFCTDPTNGELRKFVNDNGYDSLIIPSNIGGRFSVLTHVGLLPALFADINIKNLFEGANQIKENLLSSDFDKNNLVKTAEIIYDLYSTYNVNQTILMPYSSKLKSVSNWFVQLWAESLGKIHSSGKHIGLTPVPAFGATDQHSQMQLFMEGPHDKLLFLLEVKNRNVDFELNTSNTMSSAQKLSSFSLNQLMQAEFNGTLKALAENKRDYIHLVIDHNNEEHLAQLIIFFESLTALMGDYLNINPFDQPGVELGKKYAYEWLNSLG